MAGALAVGSVLRACLGDFCCGSGDGVLDKDVVVAADVVVVVVEVVESEADETDVADGGGSRTAGLVGCLVGYCRSVPALGQGPLGCRPWAAGAA